MLSRSVAPACLPPASSDPDQYADKKAIILGWGTAGNEGSLKNYYWLRCNMPFLCSILDINTPSENLLQAKVDLVANSECRSDSDFGRFVSDTSLCVSSTDVFTCAVRKWFPLHRTIFKIIITTILKSILGWHRRPSGQPPGSRDLDRNRNQQLHQE